MENLRKPIGWLILLLSLCLIVAPILGAPIIDEPTTLIQSDKTVLTNFCLNGDEFHCRIQSEDGYTVVFDEKSKDYCWAELINDELVSSGYPVHLYNPQKLGLEPNLNISREKYLLLRDEFGYPEYQRAISPIARGIIQNIVIFISFNDATDFINDYEGYVEEFNNTNPGERSVYNYFWDDSYNQLEVCSNFYPIQNGTTVLSYEAPHNRSYYRSLSNGWLMLRAAVDSLASQVPSHLNIDSDGDGYVDNITFIVQGLSEGGIIFFRSHRGWFNENPPLLINEKKAVDFNVVMDRHGSSLERRMNAIIHEFGHTLGAPDFYSDINGYYDCYVGPWCMMGKGVITTSSMSAYVKEKYFGWIEDIPVIEASDIYTLYPLASHSSENVIRINSPYSDQEYFLVEYRKRISNIVPDSRLTFSAPNLDPFGLIVYRVNLGVFENNFGRLSVYRPGGNKDNVGGELRVAYFSLESGRTAINYTTDPASLLSHGHFGGLDISDIGSAGASITFQVNISNPIMEVYVHPGNSDPINHVYDTIQEAVEYVFPNGTVYIHPGVYSIGGDTNIPVVKWEEKNINIIGLSDVNDTVVIDCSNRIGFTISNSPNINKISNLEIINISRTGIRASSCGDIIIEGVTFHVAASGPWLANSFGINLEPSSNNINILDCDFFGLGRSIRGASTSISIINNKFLDNTHSNGIVIDTNGDILHIENNVFEGNMNNSLGTSIYLLPERDNYDATAIITNNKFINNINYAPNGNGSANISINNMYYGQFTSVVISGNLFILDDEYLLSASPNVMIGGIASNNTIIDYTNNTEFGFGYNDQHALLVDLEQSTLNIKNSFFTGKVEVVDSQDSSISHSWFMDVNDPCTPVDLNDYIINIPYDAIEDKIHTGNPQIDMITYAPLWNSTTKSGLINASHLDTNGNGIPFWDDPDDQKFDGTNFDIGSVQSNIKQKIMISEIEPLSNYLWISFPYLDRLYEDEQEEFINSKLFYILGEHNENNLFSLSPRYIDSVKWNYNDTVIDRFMSIITEHCQSQ